MVEKILIVFLLLIITIAMLNKTFSNYYIKLSIHTIMYCFEIILVTYLMNIACINFELFSQPKNYLESLRNYVFYYTLYQLLLMVTFKLYDATETDALTAIKSTIDKFQVFAEFNKKVPLVDIVRLQESLDSSKITFSKKHRHELVELIQCLQSYNEDLISKDDIRTYLKIKSLDIDLQLKTISFSWTNSILLRLFK